MINWSKIADDKNFQRLINYLFALECNSPGFIPSDPYIGPDGGWDGYYKGYYPRDKKGGVYSIQSKWTKKTLNEAYKYLKGEVKEELVNAKSNNVEHLRIATNAKLRIEHVLNLETLNEGEVKTLAVWHREDLTLRIEQQPFLRHFFFGDPQHPALVPWDEYFCRLEPDLTSFPSTEIVSFKGYIGRFRRFLLSDERYLLLVHAPAGYGKSHLLRDIAKDSHKIDSTRQPWLIRAGYRQIEDAINDEIIHGRKYLLILDDADRNLDAVRSLLAFLRAGSVDIKLIFSFRSSAVYLLQKIVRESKCSEILEEIKIAGWSKDELIRLLRLTVGAEKVKDEELIVATYPNPYIIVWIGNQLKRRTVSDFSRVKNKFIEDIIYDARRCLDEIMDNRVENLLFTIACIIPFSVEDKGLLEKLGSDFDIDVELMKEAINRLVEAGVLRRVGRTIRFSPDMKGDLYLSYKLKDFERDSLRRLVLEWIPICAENIFINIGSASRYGEANIIKEILVECLDRWLDEAGKTSGSERKEIMKWVQKITYIVPEKVMNLLSVYLEIPEAVEREPVYEVAGLNRITLNTDDYGPVIYELMKVTSIRKNLLDIIERIASLKINGTYGNYKALSLIRECVSPLRNSIENISLTLDAIGKWLDEPNDVRISLVKSALSEVLAGTHHFERSLLRKFEFGEKVLPKHPKIMEMRNKALGILKQMIRHNLLDVKLGALEVAEDIGTRIMGSVAGEDVPLFEKFREERKEIVQEIGKLIGPTTDFKLLNRIENLFVRWWAQETPGTEDVAKLLRSVPRPPEYIIFSYFASREYIIEDFCTLEAEAPSRDRWGWFVKKVMSKKWEMKPEDFAKPVEELNKKYEQESEITKFLCDLDRKISSYEYYAQPLFLTYWVKINPEIFKKIRGKNESWREIPESFKGEIDIGLSEIDKSHIKRIAKELLSALPDISLQELRVFLWLIGKYAPKLQRKNWIEKLTKPRPYWKKWVKRLLKNGNSQIRSILVGSFPAIFKATEDIGTILDSVIYILSKEKKLTDLLIDNLASLIHELGREMERIRSKREKLCTKLLELLKDHPFLSWDAEEILNWAIEDVEKMLAFISYRFEKSEKIGYTREFKTIPFGGIRYLERKIKTFQDYLSLIQKVIQWYESDIFLRQFDLKYLMKPVALQRDKETNEFYLIKYIKILLQKNSVEEALICGRFLPLTQDTMDMFIEISEKGVGSNLCEDVKSLLFSKTSPEGGYSCSLGEAPPALVEIRNIFEEMSKKVPPGILKNLIHNCSEEVKGDIENHIARHQEFLAPRG